MTAFTSWEPGQTVVATTDFGPVVAGQSGMVVARLPANWFLRRRRYLCVFLGDMTVEVTGRHIAARDHGFSLPMLQNPRWFLHTRSIADPRCSLAEGLRRMPRAHR